MDTKSTTWTNTVRLESRYSVRGTRDLFLNLSEAQRKVVKDIGFGALLDVPFFFKVNRIMHAWMLWSLDTDKMVFVLSDDVQIPITREDVHRIIGIPIGSKPVYGADEMDRSMAHLRVRKIFGVPDGHAMLSTAGYDKVIAKTRGCRSESEKDRFVCAFIAVLVGKFLAPRPREQATYGELFPALAYPEQVGDYDWCTYVVEDIRKNALKAKRNLQLNKKTIPIQGCILLTMVILMEHMVRSKSIVNQNVLPRAKVYTTEIVDELLKYHMTDEFFNSYKQFISKPVPSTIIETQADGDDSPVELFARPKKARRDEDIILRMVKYFDNQGIDVETALEDMLFNRTSAPGAQAASNGSSYTAAETSESEVPLVLPLALTLKSMDERDKSFTESVRPQGSTTPGNEEIRMTVDVNEADTNQQHQCIMDLLPISESIDMSHKIDALQNEGTNGHVDELLVNQRLISCSLPDSVHGIPLGCTNSAADSDENGQINQSVSESSASNDPVPHVVQFVPLLPLPVGTTNAKTDVQLSIVTSILNDIQVPCHVSSKSIKSISNWIDATPHHLEYFWTWISYNDHRQVVVPGADIKTMLFDTMLIDRNICELAMTAFRKLEISACSLYNSSVNRHFLSPDWSNYVLCGVQPESKEFYETFFSIDKLSYDVSNCRLVIACVNLDNCWSCYVWDFELNRVVILDPSVTSRNEDSLSQKHFNIAPALHGSLLRAIPIYCNSAHLDPFAWEIVMAQKIIDEPVSGKSGMYSLYCAIEFDGVSLVHELTEARLLKFRDELLYQILHLPENKGTLPTVCKTIAVD